ncbi:hypothetical protein EV421DRAFT_1806833 [Armillaria borealis]|uniref:Uncharacterized protein n=1 Tax=Armillaria borealis TaxID=47425 RepID=A0AA39JKA7_9AGAR|nr:hypothetical protein EV421DRAFT_1806833 [Armillaria borealis]
MAQFASVVDFLRDRRINSVHMYRQTRSRTTPTLTDKVCNDYFYCCGGSSVSELGLLGLETCHFYDSNPENLRRRRWRRLRRNYVPRGIHSCVGLHGSSRRHFTACPISGAGSLEWTLRQVRDTGTQIPIRYLRSMQSYAGERSFSRIQHSNGYDLPRLRRASRCGYVEAVPTIPTIYRRCISSRGLKLDLRPRCPFL